MYVYLLVTWKLYQGLEEIAKDSTILLICKYIFIWYFFKSFQKCLTYVNQNIKNYWVRKISTLKLGNSFQGQILENSSN